MSSDQYQINKLRAQISTLKGNIEDLNNELKKSDDLVAQLMMENQLQKSQLQEASLKAKNIDEKVRIEAEKQSEGIRKKYDDLIEENVQQHKRIDELNRTVQTLQSNIEEEKINYKTVLDDNKILINKAKGDPSAYLEYMKQYKDTRSQAMSELDATRRKMNKISTDLENILAENRVLRKLAGVPENYGFDLEEIKSAEKTKIEDFKSQVRYLEREVEELEKERTQLRTRLREALTQQGKDTSSMNNDYQKTNKELTQKIQKLQEKLEIYENQGVAQHGGDGDRRANVANEETLKQLKQYQDEMKRNIEQLLQQPQYRMDPSMAPKGQTLDQEMMDLKQPLNQYQQGQYAHHGLPPQNLPGPFGNISDIREGYSNKFQQKIPVDMYDLYGENGFDGVQAKHEIAQLQLMNLELVKTLQGKTQEYATLSIDAQNLHEQLKVSLLIQDQIFQQHHESKQNLQFQIDNLNQENENILDQLSQLQRRYEILENFRKDIESEAKDSLENKLAQMSKRTAILDVNMIKLARKYQATLEENLELAEVVKDIEVDYIDRERLMKKRILELEAWKKTAKVQLSLLLQTVKSSISLEEYNILGDQQKIMNSKIAVSDIKLAEKDTEIARLKGSERALQDALDSYRICQEELVEVNLEFELLKKRLEDYDPQFSRFQDVFKKIVKFFQSCELSPQQIFIEMDENKDGKMGKMEFANVMKRLNIIIDNKELDVIFQFLDIDGSQHIEYKEFLKKLRRSGVNIRNENEQQIQNLYEHLKRAGLSLKDAFDLFDPDRSNTITKQEMEEAFRSVNIQVTPDTINYVFKMADVGGEGSITFDEWRSLFENMWNQFINYFLSFLIGDLLSIQKQTPHFIKDGIREDELMFASKLDWKKEIMIAIDTNLRDNNYQLMDLYKFMDLDENANITILEFRALFKKLGVELETQAINSLFQDIDKDDSKSIEYEELLNYIREAKRDDERVKRQKEIQDRAERMKKEQVVDQAQIENQHQANSLEGRLKMKLATSELREKNLTKRNEDFRKELNNQQKQNAKYKSRITELEESEIKITQELYKEIEEKISFKTRSANCITVKDSQIMKKLNEKLIMENSELQGAIRIFKSLYTVSMEQNNILKLTFDKRKHEKDNHREAIKELQSNGDDKALIGKLFHQIMYAKWEKSEIGKKYEKLWTENQQLRIDIENRNAEIDRQEKDNNAIHTELDENIRKYEQEITGLRGKIIPTVSINKIEELYNKITELVQMKLDLEINNKRMRKENFELQLKCDYFETSQRQLGELEKDLKNTYSDELSQKVIEQSQQISDLKMAEMRALREAMMSREKEEFYQRVNRQNTELIKNMENQVAEHQIKFAERENYWRNRCSQLIKSMAQQSDKMDQMKTTDEDVTKNLQKRQQEMEQRNKHTIDFKGKPQGQQFGLQSQQSQNQVSNEEQSLEIQKLEERIQDLTSKNALWGEMLNEKEQEIKDLKGKLSPELLRLHREQKKESIEDVTKKAIDEEGQKLAIVAQKTIQTLQSLIEDKNDQLARKDRLITKMRQDFVEEKQKDVDEIKKLSNQLISQNMTTNEKMRASYMMSDGTQVVQSEEYWGEVGKVLQQKDEELVKYKKQVESKMVEYKRLKKRNEELEEDMQAIEYELSQEKKLNKTNQAKDGGKDLEKLVKRKDKEISNFKKSLQQLKDEFIKSTVESQKTEDDLTKKYDKIKAENNLFKTIEEKHLRDITSLNQEGKTLKDKNENLEQKVLQYKGKITTLEKENDQLKNELGRDDSKKNKEVFIKNLKFFKDQIGDFFAPPDKQQSPEKSLENLKNKVLLLEQENTDLKTAQTLANQKKGGDLIDVDGCLQAQGMYFKNFEEICSAINKWIKINPRFQKIFQELKLHDRPSEDEIKYKKKHQYGLIQEDKFYQVLAHFQIKLKQMDQKKLTTALDKGGMMDLVQFYYGVNGIAENQLKESQCEANFDQQVLSKKVQFDEDDEDINDKLLKTQKKEERPLATEEEKKLSKKLSTLNSRIQDFQKEKGMLEKQIKEWKDKCLKLDKQRQTSQDRFSVSEKPPQLQRQSSGTAMSMELKDMIFKLEDRNQELESEIIQNQREKSKLVEEKKKLGDDIKQYKVDLMKARQQIEEIQKQRGQVPISEPPQSEKDQIIVKLKKNLESQRIKEDKLTEEVYDLTVKNEDLERNNSQYDQQIERLNKRIQDLEEYRKLGDQGQKPPIKTLKKPLSKR